MKKQKTLKKSNFVSAKTYKKNTVGWLIKQLLQHDADSTLRVRNGDVTYNDIINGTNFSEGDNVLSIDVCHDFLPPYRGRWRSRRPLLEDDVDDAAKKLNVSSAQIRNSRKVVMIVLNN
jgi:hypothetical protein